MALSDFITAHMEEILQEWEKFARQIPSAQHMNRAALRDEAAEILRWIAADMAEDQSREAQEEKSKGKGPARARETAAGSHGGRRHLDGFTLDEMVSEYRALRASVIRLWTRKMESADRDTLYQLTRFNEAIDQAWTESIARYAERLNRARELFLGVLGHDLRNPLGAVTNSAQYLLYSEGLTGAQTKAASSILRSGKRLERMIADLLDVARTRLGQSLPITRAWTDLRQTVQQALDEAQAYHPERVLKCELRGDLGGEWDEARVHQLLSNLVENAIRHGAQDKPVTVRAAGDGEAVTLAVHNEGEPIPISQHHRIFEPLLRRDGAREPGLGLGLYIARTIAEAHGGTIALESAAESGTLFTARLPRAAG